MSDAVRISCASAEDGAQLAYQVMGHGLSTILSCGFGNMVSIDMRDEEPHVRRFDHQLAELDAGPDLGPPARWAFGDAVIHQADLRGALGAGRVPPAAVDLAMVGAMARWREVHDRAGLPQIQVRPTDQPTAPARGSTTAGTVLVEAPLYEVFRAIAGRRSASQIAAWSWSQDPGPFIAAGPPHPFAWAPAPIVD